MTIEIEEFRFDTIIGLLDFERVKKQQVIINLKASYRYSKDNFIDYVQICNTIKESMQNKKYKLLEDALEDLKSKLFKEFSIDSLYLKISKPDILKDCIVSLSNSWQRD